MPSALFGTMFGRKKKVSKIILVVEDDALLSQVLAQRFIAENFTVTVVDNGLDAFAAAKKNIPDMVLLDLVLPGLDGFEVLKQLKEDEATEKIPVLVLSNLSSEADVRSVKALGAIDYFIKSNTEMKKIVDFVKSELKI